MPTMSVMPQQQIPQQMAMPNYPQQQQQQQQIPQQYPIYATGTQMNPQSQQNGNAPIYVPSSISIQSNMNNVVTAVKPTPIPPMVQSLPQSNNANNNNNNTYGHGQLLQQPAIQQQIPQAPQYMPTLQQQVSVPSAPVPPPPPAFQNNNIPIPPAPQMPNIVSVAPNNANIPLASSSGPVSSGGSVPPPPPLPPISKPGGMDMGSLAAQLQQAKLKKVQSTSVTPAPATENSGNSTSSSGSGNYGTIGRTSGAGEMASMMDEMAKTLARRRERQKDTTVRAL